MTGSRPVLVAPDKFKGTLSGEEAAAAIGRGLIAGGVEQLELLPLADGGEGTMEALVRARGGTIAPAPATDPLGRPVTAALGFLDDGRTAVIEVAQASGLWRVRASERDALGASTRGTGQLIRFAVDNGARVVILAAGGSATTDGGRGALEALGGRFGARGAELEQARERLRGVRLIVACDVRNPICGPSGAARTFGPQKGADRDVVERLEARMQEWARLAARSTGRDPRSVPLTGAAGGLAGGLWAFAAAELRQGAALVLDELDFDRRARSAAAVVTGEGKLDDQTLSGKLVFEVATRSRQGGVPCYAVVAVDALDAFGKRLLNLEAVAATRAGGLASGADVERAARRLPPFLPATRAQRARARQPRRNRRSSALR